MQLTRHSDYALRLLIHLAEHGGRLSIADVAEAQGISRTHLMKIANELAHHGIIKAVRGRNGGICLGRPAEEIRIGEVIRLMEPQCPMVECGTCRLNRRCTLPAALAKAMASFYRTLEDYSLADVAIPRS